MNKQDEQDKGIRKATQSALGSDLDDLDYFKDIKYVESHLDENATRKKPLQFSRFQLIASFLIALFLLSSVFAVLISKGSVSATKFKIEQQIVKIIDQFAGADPTVEMKADVDTIVMETKTFDEIDRMTDFFPELFIAKNIPNRYHLDSLTVTKHSDGTYNALYVFMNEKEEMVTINQIPIFPESSISIINISREINTEKGTIYISEDPFGDGANSTSYLLDAFIINVSGMLSVDEMLSVLMEDK